MQIRRPLKPWIRFFTLQQGRKCNPNLLACLCDADTYDGQFLVLEPLPRGSYLHLIQMLPGIAGGYSLVRIVLSASLRQPYVA